MLSLIEEFLIVAELKSLTSAAERLSLTQSTLSKHMSRLEEYLNVKLFYRVYLGIELTNAGVELMEKGRLFLDSYYKLVEDVQISNYDSNSFIKICVEPINDPVLYQGFIDFRRQYPEIKLLVNRYAKGKIPLSTLRKGDTDVVFGFADDYEISCNKQIEFLKIREESLQVIVADSHPLAWEKVISLDELDPSDLILSNEPLPKNIIEAYQKNFPQFVEWAHTSKKAFIEDLFFEIKTSNKWSIFVPSVYREMGSGCTMLEIKDCSIILHYVMCWRKDDDTRNIKLLKKIVRNTYANV